MYVLFCVCASDLLPLKLARSRPMRTVRVAGHVFLRSLVESLHEDSHVIVKVICHFRTLGSVLGCLGDSKFGRF